MSAAADWRIVVAVGAALGLAASPFWSPGGSWVKPMLVVVLVLCLLGHRGTIGGGALILVGLAAALAGLMVGGARTEAIDGAALRTAAGPAELSGFVAEVPSDSKGTARFAFDSDQGRVLIESASGEARGLTPGTGLQVTGELGYAPEWMSSDLRRRGIAMVLRADRIREDGSRRGGVSGMIDGLRDRAFEALSRAVPGREAALSRGFVLGDDGEVDSRTVEDFRRSGLSHLLAVSGQNIVLLALLAIPFLSLLGAGPRSRILAVGVLILIYVPLAGGGPSIQRAGVMGLAGLAAAAATRAPSRVFALALAAMITLLINPRATGDIGWQLSFAAVIGIMLMARPIQTRLLPVIGGEGWRRLLCEGMAVTLAATIATAPLTVFHFERIPVATLLANLAAMPAVAPAMWLGMISIAVGQLNPVLAVPFNLAGSVFLAWIAQVAAWFGRPDWAVINLTLGSPLALVFSCGVLAGLMMLIFRSWQASPAPVRPGRWVPWAVLVLAVVVWLLPQLAGGGRRHLDAPPAGGARVEVLDIGQGDAILVRPDREDPVLIDGGPPGGDLMGALDSAGVNHLSAVILTHPDLDHYGGLLELFGLVPVDRLLYDRAPPEVISLARKAGSELSRVSAGETIEDGDIHLEMLWPPADDGNEPASGSGTQTNLRSMVSLFEWRGFRMLLTGDAEAETVPIHPGPIDVLKVSHHGSEDKGLPELLDESSPRLAVISVGADNRYGHPVPDVLEELESEGVETIRTDQSGTVSIVLGNGGDFQVETGK